EAEAPTPLVRCFESGSCAAASSDEAVDQQNDDRSADGEQPGLQRPELLELDVEQRAPDETADEGADDSQNPRHDPATALPTRQDELRNRPGDEAEDDPSENSHGEPTFFVEAGLASLSANPSPDQGGKALRGSRPVRYRSRGFPGRVRECRMRIRS